MGSEGFTSVKFAWQSEKVCEKILKDYVHEKKMTERVESLLPGEWFTDGWKKWTKTLSEWRSRQSQWKDPIKRKQLLAKKKRPRRKRARKAILQQLQWKLMQKIWMCGLKSKMSWT